MDVSSPSSVILKAAAFSSPKSLFESVSSTRRRESFDTVGVREGKWTSVQKHASHKFDLDAMTLYGTHSGIHRRREIVSSLLLLSSTIWTPSSFSSLSSVPPCWASDDTRRMTADPSPPSLMKSYVDPQGLFSMDIPQRYFVIRRKNQEGDLPILTAGDMSKAQVLAVERFPVQQLLLEQGGMTSVEPSSVPITSMSQIGSDEAILSLLIARRDKQLQQQISSTRIVPDSIRHSVDDQSITFMYTTEISVQKPELLMEQMGVDRLIRVIMGKVSLSKRNFDGDMKKDGNSPTTMMMVVYGSGLQQDLFGKDIMNTNMENLTWTSDGLALKQSVDSFRVL